MRSRLPELAKMAASPDQAARLRSLRCMRERIAAGASPADFLALARPLVADADNECRWQALIVVGDSVNVDPEAVWQVVCEFGASPDEDVRVGVAAFLLEHLLELYFDDYFPRLEERIEDGSALLADTLGRCGAFGEAKARRQAVEALLRRSERQARAKRPRARR